MRDAPRGDKTDDRDTRIIRYVDLNDHLAGAEGKKPVRFLILEMLAEVENPTKLPVLYDRWERIFKMWWRGPIFDRFTRIFRLKRHLKLAGALCSRQVRGEMREVTAYFLLDFTHSPAPIDTLRDKIQRGIGAWEWPEIVALGYGDHNVEEHVDMLLSQLSFMSDRRRPYFHLFGNEELKQAVWKKRDQEQALKGS